jgi:hypothetical protein
MRTFATTLAVVIVLTFTLSLTILTSPVPESFAQGNATTDSNQTTAGNNTEVSNQTSTNDTGSVSGYSRP